MTTSAAMQSILASPLTLVANGSTRVNQFLPSTYAPRLPRNSSVRLRPMAKYIQDQEQATPEATKAKDKAKAKVVGPKFLDLFAFGGPAPERINGRLAMVGFVAAMGVELSRGQDLFGQISNGGVSWFLGTALVLSIASLIPLFKRVSVESKSESFWSSNAEMWNGRFAMLGLVALAFTEYAKGGGTLV